MKKPTPTDFGIDTTELDRLYSEIHRLEYLIDEKTYQRINDDNFNTIGTIIFTVLSWIIIILTLENITISSKLCLIIPAFIVGSGWITLTSSPIKSRFFLYKRVDAKLDLEELKKSSILTQFEAYKAKFSEYRESTNKKEQKRIQAQKKYDDWYHQFNNNNKKFWLSLDGWAFEKELAKLYRALGYKASTTSMTGDFGVDIDLRKDGKYIIVQCKAHAKPIGSPDVMKLLGSLHHFSANEAVLASTNGFTDSAKVVAKGQPIKLIDVRDILKMQASLLKDAPKIPPPSKYNYSDLQEYTPQITKDKPAIKLNDVISIKLLVTSYVAPIIIGLFIVFGSSVIVKNYTSLNTTVEPNKNTPPNSKPTNISNSTVSKESLQTNIQINTKSKESTSQLTNTTIKNLNIEEIEQNNENSNTLEAVSEKTTPEVIVRTGNTNVSSKADSLSTNTSVNNSNLYIKPEETLQKESFSNDEQNRIRKALDIQQLGLNVDWRSYSWSELSDIESRIRKAKDLEKLGLKVDWKSNTWSQMSDWESRIRKAKDLERLGLKVDWKENTWNEMFDWETRIRKANDLKRYGINVNWRDYTWSQLYEMEQKARKDN